MSKVKTAVKSDAQTVSWYKSLGGVAEGIGRQLYEDASDMVDLVNHLNPLSLDFYRETIPGVLDFSKKLVSGDIKVSDVMDALGEGLKEEFYDPFVRLNDFARKSFNGAGHTYAESVQEGKDIVKAVEALAMLVSFGTVAAAKITAQAGRLAKGLEEIGEQVVEKFARKGIGKVDNILTNPKNVDQTLANIKKAELSSWNTKDLNSLLNKIDDSGLSVLDRAKLKRETIREAGFSNFDFRGTSADVFAFKDLKIEIVEVESPMTLYRRSRAGEPESQYGLGAWWGDKPRTIQETRDELAVLEVWENPLDTMYKINAPNGTKMLKGVAAPQIYKSPSGEILESRSGGAMQYWINNIDNKWLVK